MGVLNVTSESPGLVGVSPSIIYILTDDTLTDVMVTGYLNDAALFYGNIFSDFQVPLVYTTDVGATWLRISISGGNISLIPVAEAGIVTSVGITGSDFNITNSPITSAGNIGLSLKVVNPSKGGTGINNGASTITIGGNVEFSGAYTFKGELTGNTDVIFPTSGTLLTSASAVASLIATANQTTVSAATGNVTIGLASNAIMPGTGGLTLPGGTTAERAGGAGTIRLNAQAGVFESTINGITWDTIETSATGVVSVSGTTNRITASPTTGLVVVDIAATYVGQTSLTTLGTISTGVWGSSATPIGTTSGGTNIVSYALGDTLYASGVNTLSKLSGNTTSGIQYLSQTGTGAVSAAPVWATISGGDITGAALTKTDDTNVTLALGGTPTTALLRAASLTLGWTGQLSGARGGTGVANTGMTITLGGNISTAGALTTSGAFASTFTMTGVTGVTFPTSGTLATTAQIPTGAALTKTDDTNVTLTLGGSPTTALVNAASIAAGWTGQLSGARGGTGVANTGKTITLGGNLATSGAFDLTATLTGTTNVTFPTTGTLATTGGANIPALAINEMLYASAANVLSAVGAAASSVLITSSGSVPSMSQTLPSTVQGNITIAGNNTGTLQLGLTSTSMTTTIGTGAGTSIVNIGTDAVGASSVVLGNTVTGSSLTLRAGTGNFSLNGSAATSYSMCAATTTGTITIGGTAQTGAMTFGSSSGASTVNIATGAGNSTANIATGGGTNTLNLGTGSGITTVNIGGVNAPINTLAQIQAQNGTNLLPAYSFASDTNTGMYWVIADTLAFAVGGQPKLTIDAPNGQLLSSFPIWGSAGGVGTPGYTFSVDSDTGMYRISANTLGFAVNGANAATVDATGLAIAAGTQYFAPNGTAAAPAYSFNSDASSGMALLNGTSIKLVVNGTGRLACNPTPGNSLSLLCCGTTTATTSAVGTGGSSLKVTANTGTTTGQTCLELANITNAACTFAAFFTNTTTQKGSITTDNTTTAFNTTSDYRLKHNVETMTNGLEVISKLRPVTYNWICDDSKDSGFLAHELQEHFPKAVTGKKDNVDESGKPIYQEMDTSLIIGALVSAIQELKNELDVLKRRFN